MWIFPSEQHLARCVSCADAACARFVRTAQLPDDLEMLLDEQRLGVSVARAAASFAFDFIS